MCMTGLIIAAPSEETDISFLATLFELIVPDRFAFFFMSAQVWPSNSPYQDLSRLSRVKQSPVDKRCEEGERFTWVWSHCERARTTHSLYSSRFPFVYNCIQPSQHTHTHAHSHTLALFKKHKAQSREAKLKRAGRHHGGSNSVITS